MSADVQVAQLIATGPQDVWLSGDPQVSFFRSMYRRHVPFGMSLEKMNFAQDSVTFDRRGDLLGACYITASDPVTNITLATFPISAISRVDLFIGGQQVDSQDTTFSTQVWPVTEATTFSERVAPASFYPLHFFFCKDWSRAFPLVALEYHDVVIRVRDASPAYKYTLWANMVHLAEPERAWYKRQPHRFLVTQVQTARLDQQRDWGRFGGPIKYLATPGVNYGVHYAYDTLGKVKWYTKLGTTSVNGMAGPYMIGTYPTTPTGMTFWNSPGNEVYNTLESLGIGSDIYIAKYDDIGSVAWITRIGSTGNDSAFGIAQDSTGCYTIGVTQTGGQFYNAPGTVSAGSVPTGYFLAKYNNDGVFTWATNITGSVIARDIYVDTGGIYVFGSYTSGSLVFYNQTTGLAYPTTLGPLGTSSHFLVKYDLNGDVQWITRMGGTGNTAVGSWRVVTDPDGNIYVSANYAAPVSFYHAPGTSVSGSPLQQIITNDIFLAKYSPTGQVLWKTKMGTATVSTAGTGQQNNRGLAADSTGVYLCGQCGFDMNIYNADGSLIKVLPMITLFNQFLVKYDHSGNLLWTCYSRNSQSVASNLAISDTGVYVVGWYGQNMAVYDKDDLEVGRLILNNTTTGNDGLLIKYTLDGNLVWTSRMGGSANDQCRRCSIDTTGVYISGTYSSNPITFYDPSDSRDMVSSRNNTMTTSIGTNSLFLSKFSL
jgi:hypothetical protein